MAEIRPCGCTMPAAECAVIALDAVALADQRQRMLECLVGDIFAVRPVSSLSPSRPQMARRFTDPDPLESSV